MTGASVTRGHGLLEHFLSRKRASMANTLIAARDRGGRILDIGCGSFPLFLEQSGFRDKVGLDQLVSDAQRAEWSKRNVTLVQKDLDRDPHLPFDDGSFDVVTMLAVFEHIEGDKLTTVMSEIRRVLKPGGMFVLTTPARWTDPILTLLSKLHLLSSDEVEEHQETHTQGSIRSVLMSAGFAAQNIATGSFEWGMNLWAKAIQ